MPSLLDEGTPLVAFTLGMIEASIVCEYDKRMGTGLRCQQSLNEEGKREENWIRLSGFTLLDTAISYHRCTRGVFLYTDMSWRIVS